MSIGERELWKEIQWCELHQGPSEDIEPLRRVVVFARDGHPSREVELVFACPPCLKLLKAIGKTRPAMWGGHPCLEIVAEPRKGGTRLPYQATLTKAQLVTLRAEGYRVVRDEGPVIAPVFKDGGG